MAKTKMVGSGEKTLAYSTSEFERYIDELAEECAHFVWLVAKLRKLPVKESAERDRLEQELFGSLAHLEAHVPQLRAWWEELIDTLPDDELEE
jgi:hypothetical protein